MSADKDNPSNREIADALRGLDPQLDTLVRSFDVEFERIRCITCDISFYVSKFWHDNRRNNHETFYCPNGHNMFYRKPQ